MTVKKKTHRRGTTTTITLSIPYDIKAFFDTLAVDGYNRSNLMLRMTRVLDDMYTKYPNIPLPRAIDRLAKIVADGGLNQPPEPQQEEIDPAGSAQ